jgi:hypothetical protein
MVPLGKGSDAQPAQRYAEAEPVLPLPEQPHALLGQGTGRRVVALGLEASTQETQRLGQPLLVSHLTPERHALLQLRARRRLISLHPGQKPPTGERLRPGCGLRRLPGALPDRQRSVEPTSPLAPVLALVPEPQQRLGRGAPRRFAHA